MWRKNQDNDAAIRATESKATNAVMYTEICLS